MIYLIWLDLFGACEFNEYRQHAAKVVRFMMFRFCQCFAVAFFFSLLLQIRNIITLFTIVRRAQRLITKEKCRRDGKHYLITLFYSSLSLSLSRHSPFSLAYVLLRFLLFLLPPPPLIWFANTRLCELWNAKLWNSCEWSRRCCCGCDVCIVWLTPFRFCCHQFQWLQAVNERFESHVQQHISFSFSLRVCLCESFFSFLLLLFLVGDVVC